MTKRKQSETYQMIRIDFYLHQILKGFCKKRGVAMGRFTELALVQTLLKYEVKLPKQKKSKSV